MLGLYIPNLTLVLHLLIYCVSKFNLKKIFFYKLPCAWQKCPKRAKKVPDKKGVGNRRKILFFQLILINNTKVQLETIGPFLGFDFLISWQILVYSVQCTFYITVYSTVHSTVYSTVYSIVKCIVVCHRKKTLFSVTVFVHRHFPS